MVEGVLAMLENCRYLSELSSAGMTFLFTVSREALRVRNENVHTLATRTLPVTADNLQIRLGQIPFLQPQKSAYSLDFISENPSVNKSRTRVNMLSS
jgi:hypothetical protein